MWYAARVKLGVVTEKLRTILAEPYVVTLQDAGGSERTATLRCTASLGAVLFHGQNCGIAPDTVLERGHASMCAAKAVGRDIGQVDTRQHLPTELSLPIRQPHHGART